MSYQDRPPVRRAVFAGLLAGVLGVTLALGIWHVWIDHERLHFLDAQMQQLLIVLNKKNLLAP